MSLIFYCGELIVSRRLSFCFYHSAPSMHAQKLTSRICINLLTGTMKAGHVFTIEPMICAGKPDNVVWPDNWTAATKDGKRTAQFEHTFLLTETGVQALTGKLATSPRQWWERDGAIGAVPVAPVEAAVAAV
jgi:methionyl aminopeptidase